MLMIVIYIVYSFGTDLLNKYLNEKGLLTKHLDETLLSLFTIVEFCCFSLFFYYTIFRHLVLRKIILVTIVSFTVFCLAYFFFEFSKNSNLDTIPVTFQAIFIMSLCVIFYFEQIRNPNSLFIYSTSEFWIVTGILVYLAGTFFIFIYSADLTQEEFKRFWPINYIFNTIKNLLFGLAIFIHRKKDSKANEKDLLDYQSILENP